MCVVCWQRIVLRESGTFLAEIQTESMCCNAVGPLEDDAKQNGAADATDAGNAAALWQPQQFLCTTTTTPTTATDKKSILSEYNRQQANGTKQKCAGKAFVKAWKMPGKACHMDEHCITSVRLIQIARKIRF